VEEEELVDGKSAKTVKASGRRKLHESGSSYGLKCACQMRDETHRIQEMLGHMYRNQHCDSQKVTEWLSLVELGSMEESLLKLKTRLESIDI